MRYVLKQFIDWAQFADDLPQHWTYLMNNDDEYSTAWSPKFKDAIFFDSEFDAAQHRLRICNKDAVIEGITEKEIFKRRLEGE